MFNSSNSSELKSYLLSSIVDSSYDGIISKDLNGTVTSWNKSAENILGYTESEMIGKNISIIIPQDRLDEETYIIGQIKSGKKVEHFETIRKRKDGSLISVSITISPLKDKNGTIIGASKILRDITSQKKNEERNSMLLAIIKSSDDAIISKTLDGTITSWNPAAEKMFGYAENEIIGKNIKILIPANRQFEEDTILSKIKKGEGVEHYETIRRKKDGTLLNLSITVSPMKDKNGKVYGASKIARDISERISYEKKLKEQTLLLQQLNASKDEFIGIASHELKTPLTSIKAYLQLLDRSITEDTSHEYIKRTLKYINNLSSLVEDLLDVSKIQAGKLQLNVKPFDLNELITQTVDAANHINATHKIIRKGSLDKEVIVEADPERIEQVLNNFLTNAVKYSPKADKVFVELREEDKSVVVSVTDFGIGISKENFDKIFSRFYRAEGLSPNFSGLGIGLFISHEIISRHKGKIWVESEPGAGSTFSFKIPCVQS